MDTITRRNSHSRRVIGVALALGALAGPAQAQSKDAITFREACTPGERVVVAGVGDLLFHSALQRVALLKDRRYAEFWSPVASILRDADITYGNLEGPAAYGVDASGRERKDPGRVLDGTVYAPARAAIDTLLFNYHPSLIPEIKESGFDVVSTANNHAADRGMLGIDRTIEAMEQAGLPFTGTRKGTVTSGRWSVITEAKGMKVAWLACTFSANGLPTKGQVLECYKSRDEVLGEIMELAADPAVDAVIFTPHWGNEKSHVPARIDRELAQQVIDAGATAIIGTHPHVLQPWEKLKAADGREALVVYSTGNFISNQPWEPTRHGVIAILELVQKDGGKAVLTAAGHVPTRVDRTPNGHRVLELPGKASKLLPAGNRVPMASFRDLPRGDCPVTAKAEPVAVPAVPAAVPEAASTPAPAPAPAAVAVPVAPEGTPAATPEAAPAAATAPAVAEPASQAAPASEPATTPSTAPDSGSSATAAAEPAAAAPPAVDVAPAPAPSNSGPVESKPELKPVPPPPEKFEGH